MLGISWLWWALGTFGIVGTVLLLWLSPTVLLTIVKASLTFFITNRYGNMIAVAIVVFFVADVNRSMRDEHDFAARTAAFKQEQKDRDARIAQQTRDEVLAESANQIEANIKTDKEVKEFTDALPLVAHTDDNPFRIGDDACRLRHLAGQLGCEPASPKRMPETRPQTKGGGDRRRFRLPESIRRSLGGDRQGQSRAGGSP